MFGSETKKMHESVSSGGVLSRLFPPFRLGASLFTYNQQKQN